MRHLVLVSLLPRRPFVFAMPVPIDELHVRARLSLPSSSSSFRTHLNKSIGLQAQRIVDIFLFLLLVRRRDFLCFFLVLFFLRTFNLSKTCFCFFGESREREREKEQKTEIYVVSHSAGPFFCLPSHDWRHPLQSSVEEMPPDMTTTSGFNRRGCLPS